MTGNNSDDEVDVRADVGIKILQFKQSRSLMVSSKPLVLGAPRSMEMNGWFIVCCGDIGLTKKCPRIYKRSSIMSIRNHGSFSTKQKKKKADRSGYPLWEPSRTPFQGWALTAGRHRSWTIPKGTFKNLATLCVGSRMPLTTPRPGIVITGFWTPSCSIFERCREEKGWDNGFVRKGRKRGEKKK